MNQAQTSEARVETSSSTISAALTVIGFAICLTAAVMGFSAQLKSKSNSRQSVNPNSIDAFNKKIDVAIITFYQIAVYIVGLLVGGTLSLVGFSLGIPRVATDRSARLGVFLSPLGPGMLLICLYAAFR